MSAGRLDTARQLWEEATAKGRYRGACEKILALLVDEHDHRMTAAEVHRSSNRCRDLEKLLPRTSVLEEVRQECNRQDEQWGAIRDYPDIQQHLIEDAAGHPYAAHEQHYKALNHMRQEHGYLSGDGILLEEVFEALAAGAIDRLRAELIQVAAVCVNWIMALDRRKGGE